MQKVKPHILLIDEGVTYETDGSIADAVKAITEEYHRHDVQMSDILRHMALIGYNMEDTMTVYATAIKDADGDSIYILRDEDGELIPLYE